MRPSRRIKAAIFDFVLRVWPARRPSPEDYARADFSTRPGGDGLRFNQRLRDAFRRRWLRLRR